MKKNIWKQLINEFIKTFQLFLSKIRNSYFYLKTMEDFSKVEGIKTKGGKPYVQNKELMKEIVLSKQRDELTYNAVVMLQLIAENLAKKKHYKCQEDKEDCIQTAMLDVAMYWRSLIQNDLVIHSHIIQVCYVTVYQKDGIRFMVNLKHLK